MLALQASVTKHHPYQSVWYQWIVNWRAIWYLYEFVDGAQRGIVLIGNPFTMLAGLVALGWCGWAGWALGLAGLGMALWLGWRIWRGSSHHHNWRKSRIARRLYAEVHLMRRELKRQGAGLPLAVGLHFIGWSLSGVQVWLAAQMLGLHLSLYAALAIESTATSARMIMFFVPGGLVMQEAGAVLAGAAMGVAAPAALALSLVLRLRDVAFGAALLAWPVMEWRVRQRAAGAGMGAA